MVGEGGIGYKTKLIIQVGYDGALDQGGSRGSGKKQQLSRNIWKAEQALSLFVLLLPFCK